MTARVVRFGAVWCPHWPVVAAGASNAPATASLTESGPVVVLHANRVVAHAVAAGEHGVRVGQRRREAQGACPAAQVVEAEPAREARAFEAVALAVGALVPRLEVAEPGTLMFAARG